MKILITGAWRCAEWQKAAIRVLGHQILEMQDERGELPCDAAEVDAVICNGLFLYHPIEQFAHLKYIQLTSAGLDRVPLGYIREQNITLHNARDVYSVPMAEFAVSGILQLYKKSRFFAENQAKGQWIKHRQLLELYGKTVCILGCGNVGTHCAKLFRAFGCKVKGLARHPVDNPFFDRIHPMCQLDDLLREADIVVLALPLTPETKHTMNAQRFACMKPGSILVNIARGGIVDTDALVRAMEEKLGGAVLDVFDEEPLPESSPLWRMENAIITPHNSFVGDGNQERLFQVIMENLEHLQ